MEGIFTNFRINKNIDRTGVNSLLRSIRKKTKKSSILVLSAFNQKGENVQENWSVKQSKNKFYFVCVDNDSALTKITKTFRTTVLNYLTTSNSVVVILICNMNQKIDKKKTIKEIWGLKIEKDKKNNTILREITSEEIYKFSTTNIYTGKDIPPAKELVYCGPDGKICGWDRL